MFELWLVENRWLLCRDRTLRARALRTRRAMRGHWRASALFTRWRFVPAICRYTSPDIFSLRWHNQRALSDDCPSNGYIHLLPHATHPAAKLMRRGANTPRAISEPTISPCRRALVAQRHRLQINALLCTNNTLVDHTVYLMITLCEPCFIHARRIQTEALWAKARRKGGRRRARYLRSQGAQGSAPRHRAFPVKIRQDAPKTYPEHGKKTRDASHDPTRILSVHRFMQKGTVSTCNYIITD